MKFLVQYDFGFDGLQSEVLCRLLFHYSSRVRIFEKQKENIFVYTIAQLFYRKQFNSVFPNWDRELFLSQNKVVTICKNSIKRISFSDLILNKFPFDRPSLINAEEQSIARNFYKYLNSILQSNSYIFENKITLYHDDDLYDVDLEDTGPEAAALEQPNELTDIAYLPIDEHNLEKSFLLDYMKHAVEYFDEKGPLTG
ncbi:unnamed protein product [Rotaria socialis]